MRTLIGVDKMWKRVLITCVVFLIFRYGIGNYFMVGAWAVIVTFIVSEIIWPSKKSTE